MFLLDPGIPGLRSMGPDVSQSISMHFKWCPQAILAQVISTAEMKTGGRVKLEIQSQYIPGPLCLWQCLVYVYLNVIASHAPNQVSAWFANDMMIDDRLDDRL